MQKLKMKLNGPAGAISYVNDIRRRAYGNTANDLTATQTSSQANMRLSIETERRLELNMEGHRCLIYCGLVALWQ
jgi:hypothetical protein